MKYTIDSDSSYLTAVYFGGAPSGATEYSGSVPSNYSTLAEWAASERIQAWKVLNGELTYDSTKAETLPAKDSFVLPVYLRNALYPVGSIYMSVNATDPSTFIGGSWSRITDTFLLAAGTTHGAGSSGGAESQTKTVEDHFHWETVATAGGTYIGANPNGHGHSQTASLSGMVAAAGGTGSGTGTLGGTSSAGGFTLNIDTMPPYLAVYVWKRTA